MSPISIMGVKEAW